MTNFQHTAGVLVAALVLGGCANHVWLKNGRDAPQSEYDRDSMYCTERSVNAFPPVTTTTIVENRKYVDRGDKCAYNQNYKWECGKTIEVVPEKTRTSDANETARQDFKRTCMGSLGWTRHRVEEQGHSEPRRQGKASSNRIGSSTYDPDTSFILSMDCQQLLLDRRYGEYQRCMGNQK